MSLFGPLHHLKADLRLLAVSRVPALHNHLEGAHRSAVLLAGKCTSVEFAFNNTGETDLFCRGHGVPECFIGLLPELN